MTLKAIVANKGIASTPAGVIHGVLFTFDDGAAGPGVCNTTMDCLMRSGATAQLAICPMAGASTSTCGTACRSERRIH